MFMLYVIVTCMYDTVVHWVQPLQLLYQRGLFQMAALTVVDSSRVCDAIVVCVCVYI